MAKNKSSKKYRHGIEEGKTPKVKIKKSDILRRIEALEKLVLAQMHTTAYNSSNEKNQENS
jgi:hypothetical protein